VICGKALAVLMIRKLPDVHVAFQAPRLAEAGDTTRAGAARSCGIRRQNAARILLEIQSSSGFVSTILRAEVL
jgi:hypothetical protein